jgi:hypothetical protein
VERSLDPELCTIIGFETVEINSKLCDSTSMSYGLEGIGGAHRCHLPPGKPGGREARTKLGGWFGGKTCDASRGSAPKLDGPHAR